MKIQHENGLVTFLMRTGTDLVRSQMTLASALGKINHAKTLEEKDGQIIVDDKFFFPMEDAPKSRKRRKETPNE